MDQNIIKQISEQQSKLFSEIFVFDNFVKSHEKELVELFKRQFPDVELFSGKIHVDNGHISINGMQYTFSNNKWKKL